jgi:hypothetical protein
MALERRPGRGGLCGGAGEFADDARYDDETGQAPLASGYSEVLFGELRRRRVATRCT